MCYTFSRRMLSFALMGANVLPLSKVFGCLSSVRDWMVSGGAKVGTWKTARGC